MRRSLVAAPFVSMGRKKGNGAGDGAVGSEAKAKNSKTKPKAKTEPKAQARPKTEARTTAETKAKSGGGARLTVRAERKRRGEASEAAFIAKAGSMGFPVARIWGDSDSFDVLVGMGRTFWRVQVKCAACYTKGQYLAKAGSNKRNYTKDDIDFLAAHVAPLDIWYIVPIEAFEGKSMVHLCPDGRGKAKYEKYREAWCLLTCKLRARGVKDVPRRCRCADLPVRCAVCPRTLHADFVSAASLAAKWRKTNRVWVRTWPEKVAEVRRQNGRLTGEG